MRRLREAVEASWTHAGRTPLTTALRLVSVPYGAVVAARNRAYDGGWLRTMRLRARVVSVGNLVVGGSGKTPLTLWLATQLQARGRRVAIVARGYGKRQTGVVVVGDGGRPQVSAAIGGDEAVLMARRFPGPVVTGEDRVAAGQAAIDRFGVDTIVLDDAFQHRRLARDVDVVVLADGGHGRLLPAGPYREGAGSLRRASAVVAIGEATPPVVDVPVFRARIRPRALVRAEAARWTEEPLEGLSGRAVVAAAGIARPERFLRDLEALGARIVRPVLRPDHHPWTDAEVEGVVRDAGDALIVTTEKDLVKWAAPAVAAVRALRLDVDVDRGAALLDLACGTGVLCEGGGGAGRPGGGRMGIGKEFLDVLACPKCRGPVTLSDAQDALVCAACRLRYRIEDDIPIMLIDEATPLD